MKKNEFEYIVNTLESLRHLEAAMGRYYLACSESWGEMASLWMQLALEEEKHEKVIGDLIVIVRKHPGQFRIGLKIERTAIDSFITGINEKADDVMKGKVALKEALSFAMKMEESILEGRFFELIISESRHYLSFMEVMSSELALHRQKIIEEMERVESLRV